MGRKKTGGKGKKKRGGRRKERCGKPLQNKDKEVEEEMHLDLTGDVTEREDPTEIAKREAFAQEQAQKRRADLRRRMRNQIKLNKLKKGQLKLDTSAFQREDGSHLSDVLLGGSGKKNKALQKRMETMLAYMDQVGVENTAEGMGMSSDAMKDAVRRMRGNKRAAKQFRQITGSTQADLERWGRGKSKAAAAAGTPAQGASGTGASTATAYKRRRRRAAQATKAEDDDSSEEEDESEADASRRAAQRAALLAGTDGDGSQQ